MKFDCIILNPPYHRSMHLKILAEALKHLRDEKSVCVNLSPVRWLQDPLAKYKKNSEYHKFESLAKHVAQLECISALEATDIFGAGFWGNLGIYACVLADDNRVHENFAKKTFGSRWTFVEKIGLPLFQGTINNVCRVADRYSVGKNLPWWIKCSRVHGHPGKKDEYDCITPRLDLVLNKTGHEGKEVYFNTKEEAVNFFKTLNTDFFKFIKSLSCCPLDDFNKGLPFLGSATNPRTGLVGYKGEWTDEDLYQLFGLTDEEQKIIEETMRKYKA